MRECVCVCMCVKDVEVVFEWPAGSWSAKAEFSPSDIHKQVISTVLPINAKPLLVTVHWRNVVRNDFTSTHCAY